MKQMLKTFKNRNRERNKNLNNLEITQNIWENMQKICYKKFT